MAASLGKLDGLLTLAGPASDLYGVVVSIYASSGAIPNRALASAIVKTNGVLGPGATLVKDETYAIASVNDANNTFVLVISVGGVRVAQYTEYVLGFNSTGILYGTTSATTASIMLDQNLTNSGTLGILSKSAISVGTALQFSTANTYLGASSTTYAIAAADASKPEGNAGVTPFTFFASRIGDLSAAAALSYTVAGSGTAPAAATDFQAGQFPSGTVSFAPGESQALITIPVQGDTTVEPNETFAVTLGGPVTITTPTATGTILNDDVTVTPLAYLGYTDATNGQAGLITMDAADAGGPAYLKYQYISAAYTDDIAFSTQVPNVFIHSSSGNDAIQVTTGQNVLDGGLGSNFLTGGTGDDTFFTDARQPGAVWNTIRNFHPGDAATLWGFAAGVSSYYWEPQVAGAPGSEGATLRANIVGGAGRSGNGIDASITFTGLSVDQAQNLQIVTGAQAAGNYLFVYNPGV